jgi:branched-chain amino acid aminotransferase
MTLVPFDDREGWIWFNGKLVPWRDAKLHVLSHGLHYASAVFEGERAYAGSIFRLRDHTDRLCESARILGFDMLYDADAIDAACIGVLRANGLTDAYVRPIAWRGAEALGVSAQNTRVNVAIAAWEWPRYFSGHRMAGIRLGMAKWRRPSPETAPVASKATGLYMIGTLAKGAAEAESCDDALFLDWRGRVAEATGANIFFVIDDELHTPTPDCFLDGITRRSVMALARKRQMRVVERPIEGWEIARATEIFLAGTAAEVTAVREIAGHNYTPGNITATLMQDYDALVRAPSEEIRRMM